MDRELVGQITKQAALDQPTSESVKVFGCRPFIDLCCPPRQGRRSKTSKEGNRESEGLRRCATYGDLRVAGVCCRAAGMTIKDDFEG